MTHPKPPLRPPIDSAEAQTYATDNTRPVLQFDWTEWLPYLAESDATDAQKRALIEQVWRIVCAFAELGWDVKGSDQIAASDASETSGQVTDLAAVLRAAVLQSEDPEQAITPESEEV